VDAALAALLCAQDSTLATSIWIHYLELHNDLAQQIEYNYGMFVFYTGRCDLVEAQAVAKP
jgi:hypothetical protein